MASRVKTGNMGSASWHREKMMSAMQKKLTICP
jgi:hypothetical protein